MMHIKNCLLFDSEVVAAWGQQHSDSLLLSTARTPKFCLVMTINSQNSATLRHRYTMILPI